MIEPFVSFWSFLAFGTMAFWVAVAVFTLFAIIALNFDSNKFATLFIIGGLIGVVGWLGGNINFSYWYEHPYEVLAYVAGYFMVGSAWSVFRWWRFGASIVNRIEDIRFAFYSERGITTDTRVSMLTKPQQDGLLEKLYYAKDLRHYVNNSNGIRILTPEPQTHKSRITGWILYWPFSVLGYALDEPIKNLIQWIYRRLRGTFTWISQRQFATLNERF